MRIVVTKDGKTVGAADLGHEVIYLGRSRKNDLVLSDTSISRRHAKVFTQGQYIFLEDLKSINGTRIRGELVRRVELKPGDLFEIGPFQIALEAGSSKDSGEKTIFSPDITGNTTFAEASTQVESDEKTLPPQVVGEVAKEVSVGSKGMPALQQFLTDTPPEQPEPTPAAVLPYEGKARLVRLDGDETGEEIRIEKEQVTMGRAEVCDVKVAGRDIADQQATIEKTSEGYVLRNQTESTKTFVDGVPIRERPLESHDILHVGESRFEFLEGSARSRVERSKVLERTPRRDISALAVLSDWKFLALAGLGIGFLLVLFLPRPEAPTERPVAAKPVATQAPSSVSEETIRTVNHQIGQATKLMGKQKYDEAEAHLRKVLDLSPGNIEASQLLEEIEDKRGQEKKTRADRERRERQAEQKLQKILDEGDRLVEAGEFTRAKSIYEQALAIDANSRQAKAALAELKAAADRRKREAEARRKSDEELKRLYTEGVKKFESGDLVAAQPLLEQVASRKNHVYQQSAQNLLQEIEKQAHTTLQKKLELADSLRAQEELLQARTKVKEILKEYPRHKRAIELQKSIDDDLERRAKQLYTEGIATLELAEDPGAALDKFKEALKYAPDSKSPYHQKAKAKIRELEISSKRDR